MARNRSMTRISLTGCKCVTQHHLAPQIERKGSATGGPPHPNHSGQHIAQLMHFLQLNGKRPKNLAASALASSDTRGKEGGQRSMSAIGNRMRANAGKSLDPAEAKHEEAHVRRTLRAAIINGAAMCGRVALVHTCMCGCSACALASIPERRMSVLHF